MENQTFQSNDSRPSSADAPHENIRGLGGILRDVAFGALIVVIASTVLAARGVYLQGKRITTIEGKLSDLQKQLTFLAKAPQPIKEEVIRREVVREKSQNSQLTSAVAKVVPSVVSVVISKDVPKLEVQYVNPFGDDPFFRNFDIQVPQYVQHGTEVQKVGAGTGFFVRSDGYIITNKHVAADTNAYYTVLLANGAQKPATVVYRDEKTDIAILKIAGTGYAPANLGNSADLQLGESVFAVGNALGEYNNSVSVGVVSGLNRTLQASGASYGTETLSGVIQTDAAINPGNSGGPLVDLNGSVVGVNVAMVQGSNNIGFSIPINAVKDIISAVLRT